MENFKEKVSFSYLTRKFNIIDNYKLCLFELPEKRSYRTHNMMSGTFINYQCKGIFVGYDKSSSCFLALLEDVYPGSTDRRNKATSYYISRDRFNTIFQQLLSDEEKIPTIPIKNFREEDYVAYGGETFL